MLLTLTEFLAIMERNLQLIPGGADGYIALSAHCGSTRLVMYIPGCIDLKPMAKLNRFGESGTRNSFRFIGSGTGAIMMNMPGDICTGIITKGGLSAVPGTGRHGGIFYQKPLDKLNNINKSQLIKVKKIA
jgi:hypothetical protein